MRFATTVEGLGVNFISAVLTLLAFLPVLVKLSSDITELPLVGAIPYPLVFAAVIWSVLGTGALALIGIRLPGIEFFNQRVEAAYRKELVLGEDDPARADPPTVNTLFSNISRNYFRLYLNFMYFNVGRIVYLQTDVMFPYILLAPTIVAGKITLGAMNQILNAFTQVRTSFQYLVNAWSTIVELISIYQRLRAFEAKIGGEPLPSIETGGANVVMMRARAVAPRHGPARPSPSGRTACRGGRRSGPASRRIRDSRVLPRSPRRRVARNSQESPSRSTEMTMPSGQSA